MITGERQEGERTVVEAQLRTDRISGDVMYTLAIPGRHMVLNSAAALLSGVLVGAACGLVGPLLVMKPLRSCTFEPDRTGVDRVLGTLVFVAGAALALGL